jgi:hypothetical protein
MEITSMLKIRYIANSICVLYENHVMLGFVISNNSLGLVNVEDGDRI